MPKLTSRHIELNRLFAAVAASAFLVGVVACGGGSTEEPTGGGSQNPPTSSPPPSPTPPPPSSPPPGPPPLGSALYFSDCQVGATAGCVPGNNANAGTEAAPKRDLSGINLSALPAGTTLLFKRGGSWSQALRINNPNTSSANPLTLADYGSGALPVFNAGGSHGIEFGQWQDTLDDGGYVIRNIKLVGAGGDNSFGIWLRDSVNGVIIDGVEVTNFGIGFHFQGDNAPQVRNVLVRNSYVHHNTSQGIHGKAHNTTYEGNRIERNNLVSGGSAFNHGMYLSGGNNVTVRNNRFIGNSVDAATNTCRGGNMTFHGVMDNLLIESNLIEHERGSCYGISVTAGYFTAESFTNTRILGNTIVNTGACAVCISAAPGIVVENNRVFNTQGDSQTGVQIPASGGGDSPGDAVTNNAVVRNNVLCGTGTVVNVVSTGATIFGNLLDIAANTVNCTR